MDSDREILGQLGLMLTQLGRARRALEDIERSTSRYAGLSFAPLLSSARAFGAPPLLAGALRVYVVNINDLAPGGTGIGAFFGNLLGGVGSFIGGLVGGVAGGFVGALALPDNLAELAKITKSMEKIVGLLDAMDRRKGTGKQPDEGPGLSARLPELTALVRAFTALLPPLTELVRALADSLPRLVGPIEKLYRLFTSGGDKAETKAAGPPIEWEKVLAGIHRIVQGLTHLLPIAIGSLAFLLAHMRDAQRVITDLLGWALRLVFLLRGALLVVINDTLAAGARAGVEILAILGATVERVMSAVFVAFERALVIATSLLRALATGLGKTLTELLQWVVDNVFKVLTGLGQLKVFKLVVQVSGSASAFLSLLHELLTGKGLTISPAVVPPKVTVGGTSGATGKPPKPPTIKGPDLAEAIAPLEKVAQLGFEFSSTAATVFTEIKGAMDEAKEALRKVGDAAALRSRQGAFATGPLGQSLDKVRDNATKLGDALDVARKKQGKPPSDELQMVAKAFESWLEKGGMQSLLTGFTQQFLKVPTSGPGAEGSVPGKIVGAAADAVRAEQRADVEIGELVIEIQPPESAVGKEEGGSIFSREWLEDMLEEIHFDRTMRDPFYSGSTI